MAHDEQAIRRLAYELWVSRGRPEGSAEADWFAAERRLKGQRRADSKAVDESVKESFPASDPPAPALPDKPPVNADEKWAAAESAQEAESAPTRGRRKRSSTKGKAGETEEQSSPPRGSGRNGRGGRDVTP